MSTQPTPNVIELSHLQVATSTDGQLGFTAVKVPVPIACAQPNARGSLASFETFDAFRESARNAGRRSLAAFETLSQQGVNVQ